MTDNVIQFPKRVAIFTETQKAELAKSVDFTKAPAEIVDTMESILCTQVVAAAREAAAVAAERIGTKLATLIFGK